MHFSDLGLSPEVLNAVADVGYTTPTPIQAQAIPHVLMGRDVLGCAQTGTGKTASFTLPMIDILASGRAKARMPRSLIITPTRELATQISENFDLYGKNSKLSMALLIGGSSFVEQNKRLDRGVDVLIATPGRLLDLYERGKILLADVKILVIDEADRMLDMGFIPDVERIVGLLPKIRQTLFFSATMPREVRRLADAFLMNPKEISVDPPSSAAETVEQFLVKVHGDQKQKRAALRTIIEREGVKSALIFCNRKRDVDVVFKSLKRHGFSVAALHGDMAQPVRTATLESFKTEEVRLLVCSDVAARGLDLPAVSHVFNFDVPVHAEDYVHRIGRTGRAGRSGRSYTLALPMENKALAAVTRLLGREIPRAHADSETPATPVADSAAIPYATPETTAPKAAAPTDPVSPGEAAAQPGREDKPTTRRRSRRGGAGRKRAAPPPAEAAEGAPETPARAAAPAPTRSRGESRPSAMPCQPTPSFGEHTPAFILRPVRVA
jgi:superfamily II DNA/RNA helicase